MASKTDFRGSRVFKFDRPPQAAIKAGEGEILLGAYANKGAFEREVNDCLGRIGKQTFDVLKNLRDNPRLGRAGALMTMRLNKQARLCMPVTPDDHVPEQKPRTPSEEHIRFPGFNSPENSVAFPSEQDDMRMKYNPDEDENYLSESDDEPPPRSPVSASVLVPALGSPTNKKRKPVEEVAANPVNFHLRSMSRKSPPQLPPTRTPPPKPGKR